MSSSSYRLRRLALSSYRRFTRWEFWPMWLFYIPVGIYIALIGVFRFRNPLAFTACNPAMPASGLVGERKAHYLAELASGSPNHVARLQLLPITASLESALASVETFMTKQRLDYPIVLKPNAGQRGQDVHIVRSSEQLQGLLQDITQSTKQSPDEQVSHWIVQEYIGGLEFGVFYVKLPAHDEGFIFSLTHKQFPSVVGDGHANLETLILSHPRAVMSARMLLELHREQLNRVLAQGEELALVEIGSHCRGSLFVDGRHYLTPQLTQKINTICNAYEGFYFGRFDIRAPTLEGFQSGNEFAIIEVNGVTSEATHIYDPSNSLFSAYRVLFTQWRYAFEIGVNNIRHGHRAITLAELLRKARQV